MDFNIVDVDTLMLKQSLQRKLLSIQDELLEALKIAKGVNPPKFSSDLWLCFQMVGDLQDELELVEMA